LRHLRRREENMSKLAEYIQVLADEPAEYARWRADGVEAMTRFGLTEPEQHAVLQGDPAAIRAQIPSAHPRDNGPEIPLQGTPKPQPKPPKPGEHVG
jgi:hypothetical protein